MKYNSGDIIEQNCTECGNKFGYVYHGGKPFSHRCPSCFSSAHAHNKVGTTIKKICKDCGADFYCLSQRSRNFERCENCRPKPIGSLVTSRCNECKESFTYIFKTHYFAYCPVCRKRLKSERLTNWIRTRRGNIPRGMVLTTNCRLCGEEFTYVLYGRQRRLCDDCYTSVNLVQLEQMIYVENQWNINKWIATLAAFGNVCAYCGKQVKHFHRDHFIPKVLGGISDIGNIVPSCPNCNLRKHSKPPQEFLSPEKYYYVVKVLDQLRKG